jgi:hypothetical protein
MDFIGIDLHKNSSQVCILTLISSLVKTNAVSDCCFHRVGRLLLPTHDKHTSGQRKQWLTNIGEGCNVRPIIRDWALN